jgi:hypothetical protein
VSGAPAPGQTPTQVQIDALMATLTAADAMVGNLIMSATALETSHA